MSRYSDQLTDQHGRPIAGALVYVYAQGGQLAEIVDDLSATDNPLTTDEDGNYAFTADDGFYDLRVVIGGRTVYEEKGVAVGTSFLQGFRDDVDAVLAALANGLPAGVGAVPALTRGIMSAIDPASTPAANLLEIHREGLFVWSSANHSAEVTLDTYQGIYVAPASDADGSSGAWVRKFSGPVELAWFGVHSGATTGDLSQRVESALALFGGGTDFLFPRGSVTFNRDVYIDYGCVLRGQGGSAWDPGTLCLFPAGSSGFRSRYTAGITDPYDFSLRDLKLMHTGKLATTATANFNAATRTITITGGTNDYVTGQVIRLEGAGQSHTMVGKTASVTNGNNVATIATNGGGNPAVYVGQHIDIAGAGLPAGTKVTAVTSTTITLSNNATATVAGAAYTVIWPAIGTITSGGGTATLVTDIASESQNVTGGKLSHFDCGVTATRPIQIENVAFGGNHHGNLLLRGDASYNSNTNTSQIRFNRFGSCDICIVTAGWDSNASAFWGNDISTYSQIGVLEVSLIGNFYFGNHFAFSIGIASPKAANTSLLVGNYFEQGTSYAGNGAGNVAFGNQYLLSGFGWAGFQSNGAGLKLNEGLSLQNADVSDAFYVDAVKVVGNQGAAVADLAVTATSGSLPTPNGSVTIANAAAPTNAELLEYCVELETKLETLLARIRTHGLIAA